ncbi:uncharacterized protein N7503_009111 [Penicillium pulvis]|uniref:uncharacterized protein n=1 Tax=Penicillium pulvis TaxID=1562058 RepID=UPI002547D91B|nr:uncharacterized protein N7503_009111 [Penicillium pulvis]KAJ5793133.1 hypothetical protein N7503_009111 [Penicillium pulvis]
MLLTLNQHNQQTDAGDPSDSSAILSSNPPSLLSSCSESSSEIALAQVVSPMESSSRDLPPPSALPRMPAAMPTPLPPPPSQWQGTEPMQQWLRAKAEEDRRSQEEEKTRQETLRLEQRKIEQTILADSLRAGVPPHLIPLMFAVSATDSQGDFRRTHSGAGLYPYPPVVKMPPAGNSGARPPANSQVPLPLPAQPRPVDMQPQVMPNLASPHMPPHPPQVIPTSVRQDSRTSRPAPPISFHHWVPPGLPQPTSQLHPQATPTQNQTAEPTMPPEPTAQAQDSSPIRKRKSQNTHSPVAPPSARMSESAGRAMRSGAQSPVAGEPGQHERQSEVSRELVTEVDPIGHRRLSTPQISPRSQRGSVWNSQRNSRSRSPERDFQHPPPSQNQAETSDMEISSEQDTGSGGATGNKP